MNNGSYPTLAGGDFCSMILLNHTVHDGSKPIQIVITFIYWFTSVFANVFNLLIMGRISKRFPTWPNLTIFLLSSTDFVTVLLGVFPSLVASAMDSPILCQYPYLCDFQGFVLNVTFYYSYCIVAVISVDRYLAICHPFFYSSKIARNETRAPWILFLIAAILFAFCCIVASVTFMLRRRMTVYYPGIYCAFNWRGSDAATYLPCSLHAAIGLIVVVLLAVLSTAVIIAVSHMKRNQTGRAKCSSVIPSRMQGTAQKATAKRQSAKKKRDLETIFARILLTTTLLHGALGLPFIVRLILSLFGVQLPMEIDLIFVGSLMLHTLANPVAYGIVRRSVRKSYWWGLRWMLALVCCCNRRIRPKRTLDDILGISKKCADGLASVEGRRLSSDHRCRPAPLFTGRVQMLPHIVEVSILPNLLAQQQPSIIGVNESICYNFNLRRESVSMIDCHVIHTEENSCVGFKGHRRASSYPVLNNINVYESHFGGVVEECVFSGGATRSEFFVHSSVLAPATRMEENSSRVFCRSTTVTVDSLMRNKAD